MAEYENGKWERSLPFPLGNPEFSEFSENNEGEVLQATPSFFNPDEPDEVIDIHFRMSMSQFTAIASAVDIGRDIGYGERSYELWRTWCKALIGEITVACEDVADCVEEQLMVNETLVNSITQTVNQNGFGNPNRINQNQTTIPDRQTANFNDEPIADIPQCDLDALWGGIRHGIVQRLDDSARDLLEDLANINDVVQRYQAFIDIVPVLGDVAEAAVTFATEVIPDILNAYNAHSSEEELDEIACELFALVCSECRYPTFKEVANYYAALGYDIGDMDALNMLSMVTKLSGMIAGALPPDVIYHTVIAFELLVLYLEATFNGESGARTLSKYARLGEDFGSDNWFDLCETCQQQYLWWEWDFQTRGMGKWKLDPTQNPIEGKWDGDAFVTTAEGAAATMSCAHPFPYSARAWAYKMEWELVSGTPTTFNRFFFVRPTENSTTGQITLSQGTCTNTEWIASGSDITTVITQRNQIAIRITAEPSTVQYKLRKITMVFERGFAIEDEQLQLMDNREICS